MGERTGKRKSKKGAAGVLCFYELGNRNVFVESHALSVGSGVLSTGMHADLQRLL